MKKLLLIPFVLLSISMVAGDTLHYTIIRERKSDIKKEVILKWKTGDSLNEDQKRIRQISMSYYGKKVGSGLCMDFVVQVIADYQGISFKEARKGWVDRMEKIELKDLRPGDIIDYENADIGKIDLLNHIVIVDRIVNGKIYVLEQSVGAPVSRNAYAYFHAYSGKVNFLRIKK